MRYNEYVNEVRKKSVNVDASNKCIVQCPLCERHIKDKKLIAQKIKSSGDIQISTVDKLVKFFDSLNFCGTISDPIYHKNFLEVLSRLDKNKFYRVNTNGSGKPVDWYLKAFELSGKHVEWAFSLDGLPDTSPIYRINQKSYEVWEMMKLAISKNIKVIWKYVIFSHNEHQIEEAIELAKQNKFILELVKSTRWPDDEVANKLKPSKKWISKNTDNDRQQLWPGDKTYK